MDQPDDIAESPLAARVDPALDGLARYRRRGRILFTILAVIAVVIGGLVLALGGGNAPAATILLAASSVVIGVAVDYALIVGLGAGRPWADRATLIVSTILIATGVLRSLIRLSDGAIEIPLEAIGAALVLAVRPAAFPPAQPEDGLRISLVVAVVLLNAVWSLLGAAGLP